MGSFTCSSGCWSYFWHGRCSSILPLTYFQLLFSLALKLSSGWTCWKIFVFTINIIYITFEGGLFSVLIFSLLFPEVIVHYQLS